MFSLLLADRSKLSTDLPLILSDECIPLNKIFVFGKVAYCIWYCQVPNLRTIWISHDFKSQTDFSLFKKLISHHVITHPSCPPLVSYSCFPPSYNCFLLSEEIERKEVSNLKCDLPWDKIASPPTNTITKGSNRWLGSAISPPNSNPSSTTYLLAVWSQADFLFPKLVYLSAKLGWQY